jgi:rhodanese-related sulfurtransferase
MTGIHILDVTEYTNYVETDHILVDVREVDEFTAGRLPGAVNIPLSEFAQRYTEIPEGKSVLLVCRSGGRSMQAAQFLAMQVEKNYTEVINLDGGTIGWMSAGQPIER